MRYPHEALAVVFQVRDEHLDVLLWRRAEPPAAGRWALPGGLLGADERLGTSVARSLAANVDVAELAHLEQLETRSDPLRDPRGRRLATAYLGLIPVDQRPSLPPDTGWHRVEALPPMAFDHGSIVASGRNRLRAKLSYTTIALALAPTQFTISTLRAIYAAALGYDVSATNLQRVLLRRQALVPTDGLAEPGAGGGRPARLYRFAAPTVQVTDPFAALRPPP
ncbi:MAG: NUDIX domain-containing protein [Actinomycetota bacterium]|nr:NUDIX domain-containing protein [Actinomycetota bacterium]